MAAVVDDIDSKLLVYAGGSIPREVAARSKVDFVRYFSEWSNFVDRQRVLATQASPADRRFCA